MIFHSQGEKKQTNKQTKKTKTKQKKEKMIREYDFIWIPNRKQTTIVNSVQFTVPIIITIL